MRKIIEPQEGYPLQLGLIVSEINHVRNNTKRLVQELKVSQLDFKPFKFYNSIATLLFHLATMEFNFFLIHFAERKFSNEEYAKYSRGLPGIMINNDNFNKDLDFFLYELESVRSITLQELKNKGDSWLFERLGESNNYFHLKHLIEDEISHQGQIKLILKHLSFKD